MSIKLASTVQKRKDEHNNECFKPYLSLTCLRVKYLTPVNHDNLSKIFDPIINNFNYPNKLDPEKANKDRYHCYKHKNKIIISVNENNSDKTSNEKISDERMGGILITTKYAVSMDPVLQLLRDNIEFEVIFTEMTYKGKFNAQIWSKLTDAFIEAMIADLQSLDILLTLRKERKDVIYERKRKTFTCKDKCDNNVVPCNESTLAREICIYSDGTIFAYNVANPTTLEKIYKYIETKLVTI